MLRNCYLLGIGNSYIKYKKAGEGREWLEFVLFIIYTIEYKRGLIGISIGVYCGR